MSSLVMSVRDIAAGNLSPVEVVEEVYRRIEAYPDEAVWIALVDKEDALATARALMDEGPEGKPLYGVPFAVKDNIDSKGLPTTAACPAFAYEPEGDATVVARLKAAGAILIGRTNMDQFATGLVGARSPHGAPRSVFDPDYVSGGSSSGSAVAVAAELVAFSLGTDTAGSGRVPAAFNNIVGVKPTKGLIPVKGVVPACASLDCVSIFARDMGDADLVRRVAEGFDAADIWSRKADPQPLPPLPRVGVLRMDQRDFKGNTEAARLYADTIGRARALGWQIVEFDYAPFAEVASLLYAGPYVAERQAAVGDFIAQHEAECDPTVAAIIKGGANYSAEQAFAGQYRLLELKRRAEAEWANMDMMLLPTAPTQYTVDAVMADPVTLNANLGLYTNFVNLMDLAAVAVPAGMRPGNGLPFGVTLIGPAFSDGALAELADHLHRTLQSPTVGGGGVPLGAPLVSDDDCVHLAVVGAHLRGQPLNHQLTSRGAAFLRTDKTASDYKLYALKGTVPAKPGLAHAPGFKGQGLEVEVWALSAAAFGRFTEEVPPPLAIGNVRLADGSVVKGFVCEGAALADAEDITAFGGWRAYMKG
jgi:allophanate hydrolase